MSKCQNKLIYMLQNILDLVSYFPDKNMRRIWCDCQFESDKIEKEMLKHLSVLCQEELIIIRIKKMWI